MHLLSVCVALLCAILLGGGTIGCKPEKPPSDPFAEAFDQHADEVGLLAVQDEGRFKTFDTLASSVLTNLTGQSRLRPEYLHDKTLAGHSAVFTCLDIIFRGREQYYQERIVYLKNPQLRNRLLEQLHGQISPEEREQLKSGYVSMAFLDQPHVSQALTMLSADVMFMQRHIAKLQDGIISAQTVYQRAFVPPAVGDSKAAWLSLRDLIASIMHAVHQQAAMPTGSEGDPLAGYSPVQRAELHRQWLLLVQAWGQDGEAAGQAAVGLAQALEQLRPDVYPPRWQRQMETFYIHAGKFTWVWTLYAAAACLLLMAAVRGWPRAGLVGVGLFGAAFALHTLSIALRWMIAGRIPIATQFESMLAAGWFSGLVALGTYFRPKVLGGRPTGNVRWVWLAAMLLVSVLVGVVASSLRDLLWMAGRPGLEHVALGTFVGLVTFLFLLFLATLIGQIKTSPDHEGGGVAPATECRAASPGGPLDRLRAGPTSPPCLRAGLVLRADMRRHLFLLAASVACMVALWFGHYRPVEAGADIRTIEPILNDTLLYIHVNVIILSYALVAMAAVISLVYLVSTAWFRLGGHKLPQPWREVLDGSTMSLLQVCFIVLWAGIILGAWWADYSWGRPWGWDPKEVFALNTWLVLLILVHVRWKLADEQKTFWTATLCVLAGTMMVFNYYWVNFVIPGLHSYA